MSTNVGQIKAAIVSDIASTLPDHSQLKYVYDIEKNSFIDQNKRFGVRPAGASVVEGVVRTLTIDQSFEVVLTQGYKNIAKNDSDQQAQVDNLFDRIDDVAVSLHQKKAGLPGIVLHITLSDIADPEFNTDEKVVSIVATFIVKYRTNL